MSNAQTTDGPAPARSGSKTGRDVALIALLMLVAVGLGLGVNQLRGKPLPLVYASKAERLQNDVARLVATPTKIEVSPTPAGAETVTAEPEMIDLSRFHELLEKGAVALDARPRVFYRVGHVPGAMGLSRAEFEADYARLHSFLEAHRQETVIVYCAGEECADSRMVASALGKLGYRQVLIFAGGWDEWRQAGLPEERS